MTASGPDVSGVSMNRSFDSRNNTDAFTARTAILDRLQRSPSLAGTISADWIRSIAELVDYKHRTANVSITDSV